MTEKYTNNRIIFIFYFILLIINISCIPAGKLDYFNDNKNQQRNYDLFKKGPLVIKPLDELYIRVSSFDDISYNFFGTQAENRQMSYNSEIAVSLISYIVNDSGYIYYPIIGSVCLKDLTLEEATQKLKNLLDDYFNQPTVIIKFVNKNISVIGEVHNPGRYTYTKEHISIFEALSLAGDITINGNRKKVIIIREKENKVETRVVNLTKSNIFNSENYFIYPNDVIYVKHQSSSTWSTVSTPISLLLSTITTFILVLRYIE